VRRVAATNVTLLIEGAFSLVRLQVSAQRKVAALDKIQPEAQIPANPANHRANSVVTGRRRVVRNQQSGQADLSIRIRGFIGGSRGDRNWSVRFAR
jgi:hypothetical protein